MGQQQSSSLITLHEKFQPSQQVLPNPFNIVVIGGPNCHKSNLIRTYLGHRIHHFDNEELKIYHQTIPIDYKTSFHLQISDIPCDRSDEMENQVIQVYKNAQVFLLCFSLTSQEDLHYIADIEYPLVHQYSRNKKVVLCGVNFSLRDLFNVSENILPHQIKNFYDKFLRENCVEYIRLCNGNQIMKKDMDIVMNICMYEKRLLNSYEKQMYYLAHEYYQKQCEIELDTLQNMLKNKKTPINELYQRAINFRIAVQYLEDVEHDFYKLNKFLQPIYQLCHHLELIRSTSTSLRGDIPYKQEVII